MKRAREARGALMVAAARDGDAIDTVHCRWSLCRSMACNFPRVTCCQWRKDALGDDGQASRYRLRSMT